MNETPTNDPRIRFAAERTLLAWVRTGLALMGFGFVVAKFGLFLNQLAFVLPMDHPHANTGWSLRFGIALVLFGVVVTVLSAVEFRAIVRRIDRGEQYLPSRWSLGLVVAVLLSAVGMAMITYLLYL